MGSVPRPRSNFNTNGNNDIGNNFASPAHPECMPINIPVGDPAYGTLNCMGFVRSTFGQNLDGCIPPNRKQINSNTHWMDGSQVYGSSDAVAQSLRDKTTGKGLLKTSVQNGPVLLPLDTTCCPGDATNTCAAAASCFLAGDSRVAEQPLLTIMHTLWVREHNRIATGLAAQFPGNTDEFYFQQTRLLVIAELQHITYTEYLPVLIGRELAKRIMTSTTTNYRPNADPAIFNEFAVAAYRMGHSQLRSFIRLFQADGRRSNDSYSALSDFSSSVKLLQPAFIDNALYFLRPLYFSRNYCLFQEYLPKCQCTIDLYIGGVTENPIQGALVGPTFAKIIARQFDNLKHADRFFYNDLSQPGSFTPGQLEEIRKTSLARIICDNSDGTIDRIQPDVFRTAGPHNEPVPCNKLPTIDFAKLQPPPPSPPIG